MVDRTMSWGATGYGSHAESGVAAPATTWYLAEGSTSGDFALFYLLQNPNRDRRHRDRCATCGRSGRRRSSATTRCRPTRARPFRSTVRGRSSRATDVSRGHHSDAADHRRAGDVSQHARRKSSPPATGRPASPRRRRAGSSPRARPARSSICFILLANPDRPAATGDGRLPAARTGRPTRRATAFRPNGRFTIWVDEEQIPAGSGVKPLDNVAVSSTITSTNGVPIIVERAMWWPSPALTAALLDGGAQLAWCDRDGHALGAGGGRGGRAAERRDLHPDRQHVRVRRHAPGDAVSSRTAHRRARRLRCCRAAAPTSTCRSNSRWRRAGASARSSRVWARRRPRSSSNARCTRAPAASPGRLVPTRSPRLCLSAAPARRRGCFAYPCPR